MVSQARKETEYTADKNAEPTRQKSEPTRHNQLLMHFMKKKEETGRRILGNNRENRE